MTSKASTRARAGVSKQKPVTKSTGRGRTDASNEKTRGILGRLAVGNIFGPVTKADPTIESASRALAEAEFAKLEGDGKLVPLPFDKLMLTMLPEQSTALRPLIDAMVTNTTGFGHRLQCRINLDSPDCSEEIKEEVRAEKHRLMNFFHGCCSDMTFDELTSRTREDIETTGEGFWEVLRTNQDEIVGLNHIPSYQMRLGMQDEDFTIAPEFTMEIEDDGGFRLRERKVPKRFRPFVQARSTGAAMSRSTARGYRARWFKEFGDPRPRDNRSGEILKVDQATGRVMSKDGRAVSKRSLSTEIIHFKLYSPRTPHGLPRFIGNLVTLYGDRAADEINFITLRNNNVPSMMILVANGQLTDDSIDRMKEYVETQIQGSDNWSRMLILEIESPFEEEGKDPKGSIKAQPMVDQQMRDQMFVEFGEKNQMKLRATFRLPPIFVGRSDEYTRSTAESSRRLADEQVFAPNRKWFDGVMNMLLMPSLGATYHRYITNGPNVTDDEDLIRILQAAERSGGMTPRLASHILSDVLNDDDLPMPIGIPLDIPFSLTMAKEVKNQADPGPGSQVTALKAATDPIDSVRALIAVREQLEKELAQRTGG